MIVRVRIKLNQPWRVRRRARQALAAAGYQPTNVLRDGLLRVVWIKFDG